MLYSYNWLKEYIKENLPAPKELERLLAMHAFEVEEVKHEGKDWIFDISVLPNRAHDTWNHLGMAREIAAITGKTLIEPKKSPLTAKRGNLKPIQTAITAKELVPRYAALVIEGVKVKESPKWLKDRLEAVGVNSINTIVDVTNYVMLEIGQPLHAFDYDKIQGHKMIVRNALKGEELLVLDDSKLALPETALVIEDASGLIDLAGIKGGKVSGISKDTKNIVLQAATFDSENIYQTKKYLNYRTQAADLYAAGLDPNVADLGLARAWYLLQQLGGGKITQIIDIYPKKTKPTVISLDMEYADRLLGLQIPAKESIAILKRLGFGVALKKGSKNKRLLVTIPTRRLDVSLPEDLIEEIGRIYGYTHIVEQFPTASLMAHEKNLNVFWQDQVRDILKTAGMTETYNLSFIGEADIAQFQYTEYEAKRLIELENPLSLDIKYMRPSLIENLAKNVSFNQKKHANIQLFELGKVYFRESGKFCEENEAAGIMTDKSFYDTKGIVDFLFESLGIPGVWYDNYEQIAEREAGAIWHPAKSAEIKIGDKQIGFVGELSKGVLSRFKIARPVCAFSLNLDELSILASEEKSYSPPSRFPASIRDIAIIAPTNIRTADIENIIETSGGELVEDVDLFDMYEGAKIGENRKSLAFHIIYQAKDRTLTSNEVDQLHAKIISALEQNPDWEVRK